MKNGVICFLLTNRFARRALFVIALVVGVVPPVDA